MASVVYQESQSQTNKNLRSLCVDAPPSSSPFPSPSSSFLPPPTPGAHEFAMKPPPPGRASRKGSVVPNVDQVAAIATNGVNGHHTSSVMSPSPPNYQSPSPPSSSATPTANNTTLPDTPTGTGSAAHTASTPTRAFESSSPISTPNSPSSPVSYFSLSTMNGTSTSSQPDTPSSTRPAPSSPAISRRVSQAPSTSSTRSRGSRSSKSSLPSSSAVSRANSTRKQHPSDSSPLNFSRLSSQLQNITNITMTNITNNVTTSPSPSPTSFTFVPPAAAQVAGPSVSSTQKVPLTYVKVRDFAFPKDDERHLGLGTNVPRPNKVARLNRVPGSWESASEDGDEDDEEGDDGYGDGDGGFGGGMAMAMAMGGFQFGVGRLSFSAGQGGVGASAGAGVGAEGEGQGQGGIHGFPSRIELDRNFLDEDVVGEEETFYDVDSDNEEEEEEEGPLYPGLYRAMYAFDPEGTAEMALAEDQIIRVIGRGGGVGWAVVVDDRERDGAEEGGKGNGKLALVPESYLEPVRLDGDGLEE